MPRSKIEWLARPGTVPESWNPITGCSKVSEGCAHCYAERMARRLAGRCGYPEAPHHFDVTLHTDRLKEPLQWQEPRTVFVCSMADLWHEDVADGWLESVWQVMYDAKQHTFLILTKRPERMLDWISRSAFLRNEPLSNVWLGVTAENQQRAEERIPLLVQTPAAVRFVSCEPLLGEIDLGEWLYQTCTVGWGPGEDDWGYDIEPREDGLCWVIAGGETGPGARPSDPDWFRDLRDQCAAVGIPYFLKQRGEWMEHTPTNAVIAKYLGLGRKHCFPDGTEMLQVGRTAAGHLLDGREHREWPE